MKRIGRISDIFASAINNEYDSTMGGENMGVFGPSQQVTHIDKEQIFPIRIYCVYGESVCLFMFVL